jgi:hypothetical protein
MTLTQLSQKTATPAEVRVWLEANRGKWTELGKMIMEMNNDEAMMKFYADLPRPKREKKSSEEKEAKKEAKKAERAVEGQKRQWQSLMTEMDKPFKNEELEAVNNELINEMFGLLEKEERLAIFKKMLAFKKRAGEEAVKNMFVKGKRKSVEKEVIDAKRERNEDDLMDTKRCGYTGEKVKACLKQNDEVVEYEVISVKDLSARGPYRTAGGGIYLEEGEVVMWDMTGENKKRPQVKVREEGISDCRYPIDYIREGGCEIATKWGAAGVIYKKDESGVYRNVPKDWGFIPCNIKCGGGRMCNRHLNAKKDLVVWTRDMLKVVDEDKILSQKDEDQMGRTR